MGSVEDMSHAHLHKQEEWIIYQESFWLDGPEFEGPPTAMQQICRL